MLGVALLFLGAYAWPILDPDLAPHWRTLCMALTWLTWGAFVADYAVRLFLARDRWHYIRVNAVDLVIILLPALRPLRLLRLLSIVTVLNRRLTVSMRKHVAMYAVVASSVVLFCAALAVLEVERDAPGATITTFEEALWWAAVTVTTVGYGDFYPVTSVGRLIAFGLFLGGITLLGVVTGTLASWFVERVDETKQATTATRAEVEALMVEVQQLRSELSGTTATESGNVAAGVDDRPG
ncbi:potassium channel protein [Halostreptopolyspora alba]|uniref:Potassium channel protein n=2 Tax=Halostreptopolyspora alba TaxID=2487137 RepID=A0A3N0EGR4_9ACTN|nr:potassium channel protein [Nocardiopsaceae bacterium YIM 96095]